MTGQPPDLDAIMAIRERDARQDQRWLDLYRHDRREDVRALVDRRDLLAEVDRLAAALTAAQERERRAAHLGLETLRRARGVITQMLSTAEKWRYDRVCWAFAVMLAEIPEDTPEPPGPEGVADERGCECPPWRGLAAYAEGGEADCGQHAALAGESAAERCQCLCHVGKNPPACSCCSAAHELDRS